MTSSFVTVVVPFDDALADGVLPLVQAMGNPAAAPLRCALGALGILHFMSLNVIRAGDGGGDGGDAAHLLLELSADGPAEPALQAVAGAIAPELTAVLDAAGHPLPPSGLARFLARYSPTLAADWIGTWRRGGALGLPFCGSPGMEVRRILAERDLADRVAGWYGDLSGSGTALDTLSGVRERLWQSGDAKWAFAPQQAPFLGPNVARTWWTNIKIFAASFQDLLWPLVLPVLVIALLFQHTLTWRTLWLPLVVIAVVLIVVGTFLFYRLRQAEATEEADNIAPDPAHVAAVMSGENFGGLNLLVAVTRLKPGWFRTLTLRFALWFTGQTLARSGIPGFLGDVGTVQFARWIVLPGTDKLAFVSNYDGAWESYLEDFIQLVADGVTAIWTSSRGFLRTHLLFGDGARDGNRFRRYVRRFQIATGFWYAAYPDLTLEQMRVNARIRLGIASAQTEQEAQAWLSLFSAP